MERLLCSDFFLQMLIPFDGITIPCLLLYSFGFNYGMGEFFLTLNPSTISEEMEIWKTDRNTLELFVYCKHFLSHIGFCVDVQFINALVMRGFKMYSSYGVALIRCNNLAMFKKIHEDGHPVIYEYVETAALTGNLKFLEYLFQFGFVQTLRLAILSIESRNYHSFRRLMAPFYTHPNAFLAAKKIIKSNLPLYWIEDLLFMTSGLSRSPDAAVNQLYSYCAKNNKEVVFMLLIRYKCKLTNLSYGILEGFAMNGNLEMMKLARKHHAPWSLSVLTNAACYGHLDCLKYGLENGCKFVKDDLMNKAIGSGDVEIVRFVRMNCHVGCVGQKNICVACQLGHLDILRFLHDCDCCYEAITIDEFNTCIEHGRIECLQYLHSLNRCKYDRGELLVKAAGTNCEQYVQSFM